MNKIILSIFIISVLNGQNTDSLKLIESDSLKIDESEVVSDQDSLSEELLIPPVRNLLIKKDKLDSLKKVISTYEEGKGAMPTIDEDLLNLIKVPQLRHRVELQNGTVVNGEIIEEDELGVIIQTSIGQLAIEKNRIVDIMEDLPPSAKIEIVGEPFVDIFPDREEITGSIKNIGTKRADFVRVIANLWSPTTTLLHQDSVFISGQNQKYFTGIKSDAALEPGSIIEFKLVLPLNEGDDVSYRTYEVRWESYK